MDENRQHWSLLREGLSITEESVDISVLRVRRGDTEAAGLLGRAFGLTWPVQPNSVSPGILRVAWLEPGVWAIYRPARQIRSLIDTACGGRLHHLSQISAGRRLWRVDGAESRTIIARSCSIDTHPSVFGAGRCAQTLFAQVPVFLAATGAINAIDIVADVSFKDHLRAWFVDAAQALQPCPV